MLTNVCSVALASKSRNIANYQVCECATEEGPGRQNASGALFNSDASMAQGDARPDNGFVLLIVLWWLAFLLFVVAQIAAATRTAILISSNIRTSAVAEAQADGAVSRAIFEVLAQRWGADGTIHLVRGPQVISEVRIEDEGGKIDPNVAPVVLLQALLSECGAPPKTATVLGIAIFEWRSLDMLQSAGTEKASRYRAAGRSYAPPNTRFVSVDELGLVLGMTPELLTCLEPHVSVDSLSVPSVQIATDRVVRQALAEAYPNDAAQQVAAVAPQVEVIRITATAREAGGGQFRRVAVVRVAPTEPDDNFTYRILSWE
jgi:general secretion pathway protein K